MKTRIIKYVVRSDAGYGWQSEIVFSLEQSAERYMKKLQEISKTENFWIMEIWSDVNESV